MIKELCTDTALLSTPCQKATAEDAAIAQDLLDTLAATENAACLAANQIGETKCIFVFLDEQETPHVVYNPYLARGLYASKVTEECLTLEGAQNVRRFEQIRLEYQELVDGALVTKKKDFTGWEAEIIQHMIDHCHGKLI